LQWPDREIFTAGIDVCYLGVCRPDLLRVKLSGPVSKRSWCTLSQRGERVGVQQWSLDERQENVLHDLKRSRPSAADCAVLFISSSNRIV
jgi:hypothetical protein